MGFPTSPFPLCWPEGWARTKLHNRVGSRFTLPVQRSWEIITHELGLMPNATKVMITSNLPVSSRGAPYAAARVGSKEDSGVAVWWVSFKANANNVEQVIACDKYFSAPENMAAIAHSIQAIRGLSRWGATDIVTRAFAGFTALPPPSSDVSSTNPIDWRSIFDINVTLEQACDAKSLLAIVRSRYREDATVAHPDRGGSPEKMLQLNAALEAAEQELARGPA